VKTSRVSDPDLVSGEHCDAVEPSADLDRDPLVGREMEACI
jgi:hypothetical protein